jgi:hypothetical protein
LTRSHKNGGLKSKFNPLTALIKPQMVKKNFFLFFFLSIPETNLYFVKFIACLILGIDKEYEKNGKK